MATPTAQDQLFLELVNRARLDPAGEAARFGIDLNQGLSAGTISAAQKQVLTFNLLLNDAAYSHSAWMLTNDVFSHTGANGTNAGQRMSNAGYSFSGSWSWGENIAWVGTTGTLDVNASILQLHQNLFLSSGHRTNMLNANFKETGISAQYGQFRSGSNFNAEMVTEVFAYSGTHNFVTGVAYHDTDNNDFYSVGEGDGGYNVALYSGSTLIASTTTWGSGGYSLDTTTTGTLRIAFSGGSLGATVGATFALGSTNVKIDIVDGNSIQSSVSATLTDAAVNLMLLGINSISGTGNGLANIISGNKGGNILTGLGGNDTLKGGLGADQYVWSSGDGNDTVDDASTSTVETDALLLSNVASTGVEVNKIGNDLRIVIVATGEIITVRNQFNTATGGSGIETLGFSGGVNWNRADIASHLQAAAPINGTMGADVLIGTSETDTVNGLDDDDMLNGLGGGDLLNGGNGVDTASYSISTAGVTVNLGSGVASGGHAAGDALISIENLQGSAFNDLLTGNIGDNRLDGGLGADTMTGGLGDDTYAVDIATDKVVEIAGQGTDTVETSLAAYSLAALAAVENLTYTGVGNFTGAGNALANRITGGTGNDILNGGLGADTLAGGAGNDTYVVDHASDVVDEASGSGTDLLQSAVSFDLSGTLGSVENLTLTGSLAINGTGNGLANTIIGNTGANMIEGKGGADILDGGTGIDTVSYATSGTGVVVTLTGAVASIGAGGDAAGDSIKNFENVTGSAFADTLTGDGAANAIDGGAGVNAMNGGLGNDTYIVDNLGDSVVESLSTGGIDLVKSSVDFVLGVNLENLTLTGSAGIDATGNASANILTGNIGDNRLDGGLGADTMTGGLGDDTYAVDIATDKVVEIAGQGTDTVETSLAAYSLAALAAVENLTYTGVGNFTGAGNALANRITGGTGNDILNGGLGANTLAGGAGNDTYVVDHASDVVDEASGSGTDLLQSAVSFDLSGTLGSVENLTLTGSLAINGTGNGLANTIIGNTGANMIEGKGGADILDGGTGIDTVSYATSGTGVVVTLTGAVASIGAGGDAAGDSIKNFENVTGSAFADTLTGDGAANAIDGGAGANAMNGGLGNDTYIVDNLGDSVVESLSTGGIDLVKSSVDFVLGVNLENLTLTGSAGIDATGNASANILTGNIGDNRLDGGLGADTMTGGLGDDTYAVDIATDKVVEIAGQGTDTVETSLAAYSLAALAAVENLTYTGVGNFTGAGNALANRITGGTGNDILNGGLGANTLAGGAGNDTYVVDHASDVVDEASGSGTDLLQSAVSFDLSGTLGSVENLTLTGSLAINGTGNGLANTIIGNTGANMIEGKGGANILDGGTGIDTVSYATSGTGVVVTLTGAVASIGAGGDAAGDSIKNFENVTGSAFADTLTGDGAANAIDGGAGANAMNGGLGNDTYIVDNLGDSVVESLSTGGIDLVKSSVDFVLGVNLENLTLTGSAGIDATGNASANILTGNIGDNRLDGGLGADTMTGGLGDDTYAVDIATDKVVEIAGQGTDTVETSLAAYSLAALAAVENLTYTGVGNFTGAGNALANRITGGTGNDILNGGLGANTLAGGAGNDTFTGGTGNDTFSFTDAGFGNDKVTDYLDNADHLSFATSIADSFDDFTITGNGTKSVTVTIGLDSVMLVGSVNINLAADDFIFV